MTTIHKASGPADLLRLIPSLLGYVPSNSLVVLPMGESRTLGAMRLDLPDTAEQSAATAVTAASLVVQVAGATDVITVGYGPRNDVLHDWLASSLDAKGLTLIDSLYVDEHGWGSYQNDGCGPASEIIPEQIPGLTIGSNNVLPLPDPGALAGCEPSDIDEEISAVVDDLEGWYFSGRDLKWVTCSVLMALLARPATRDVLLMQAVLGEAGGDLALQAQMEWEDGVEYPTDLAKVMWGDGPRPDVQRLQRTLELARTVLSVRPEPGAYAFAGWLAWALGHSTHASQYAQLGLAMEPEHGLCQIVESFVNAGHLPGWAFTRS